MPFSTAVNFLYPVAALRILCTAVNERDMRYARERLWGTGDKPADPNPIWIHCASVGELNMATPLIQACLEKTTACFVVTTNTRTAAEVFKKKNFPDRVVHRYMPLDYSRSCKRFLRSATPRAAWIMETELWLNIFEACRAHPTPIPISIVNARLSHKTINAAQNRILKSYYKRCLRAVTRILARSEEDAHRFEALGASPEKIHTAGNLKYAFRPAGNYPRIIASNYFLASSTHDGEEYLIANAFLNAYPKLQNRQLVIAPRHPHRAKQVEQYLRQNYSQNKLRIATRHTIDVADEQDKRPAICIIDTVGELHALIAHADFVVTGGSLVAVGGHNVLEPAALGTPQAVGMFTRNQTADIVALRQVHGLIEVADSDELIDVFEKAANGEYAETAEHAQALARDKQVIIQNYLSGLHDDLPAAQA